MSLKREFKDLLLKLSQDPNLRTAMNQMRGGAGKSQGGPSADGTQSTISAKSILQILLFSSQFIGKRRLGPLGRVRDLIDIVTFLVTLSLLVKENVFDRPEVRDFLRRSWDTLSTQSQKTFESAKVLVEKQLQKIQSRPPKRRKTKKRVAKKTDQ